jgi:type IV pilus assembly protein PilV
MPSIATSPGLRSTLRAWRPTPRRVAVAGPAAGRGFTLLEILVTLVVVSVGLLGIAAIIGMGLKNNQSASHRTQAVWLANDIVDRMRANRSTAQTPVGAKTSCYALAIDEDKPAATDVCSTDLNEWRTALENSLPTGTGSVARDAATNKVTIVVQWDDSRGSGGQAAEQITVETRL